MFTTFLSWLWAALLLSTSLSGPQVPPSTARPVPVCVFGDSTLYLQLQTALAHRAAETAPEKCYLHTDRTLLAPGDTLWWNAYVRNATDLMPSAQSEILYIELLDPRGTVVRERTILALSGTAAGEFAFDKNWPGGTYKLRARTAWMRNTEATFERDITLQKTVLPRLNLRLEWERKAVGPGEVAIARFDGQTLDNQPLARRTLRYTASAEGKDFAEGNVQTDAAGRAYIRFEVPKKINNPDGLLNIQAEHNGQMEAISRAIPLVLNRIDLQFFPEGGDAVAGLPCRMAFKAINEFGKAADVSGSILDSRDQVVTTFSSWHNGMGAFDFQPRPGERYTARLEQPAAAARTYDLPDMRSQGFGLRLSSRSTSALQFEVSATRPGQAHLVGMSRDKVFFFKTIHLHDSTPQGGSGEKTPLSHTISIPTDALPIGIARFTLLDEKKTELAERLVFVNRDRGLRFHIRTDKSQYLPRETVKMRIRATDAAGQPVQGQFSLGVTDESLLTYADDKQGHLLSALLLEQDLSGPVEEPNFYFDAKESKAEQALDYLLMTQGWRRFAWKEVLQPAPLVYAHKPERATVQGLLYDRATGKPLAHRQLSLHPEGATVITDTAGHFVFRQVDITRHHHIRDQQDKLHQIADFNLNMAIREGVAEGMQQWYYEEGYPDPAGLTWLAGRVMDEAVEEGLIGATIKVLQNNTLVRGIITDYEGNYRLQLPAGMYDLELSYVGYTTKQIKGVQVQSSRINICNTEMSAGAVLTEVAITSYKVPLIKQDQTSSGQTIALGRSGGGAAPARAKKEKAKAQNAPAPLTSDAIRNLPTRQVEQVVGTMAGATAQDEVKAANIRGSRSNTTEYYIDGVRLSGAKDDRIVEKPKLGNVPADFGNRLEEDAAVSEEMVVIAAPQHDMADQTGATRTIRFDAPETARKQRRAGVNTEAMRAKPAPAQARARRQYVRARQFYVPRYSGPVSQRTDFRPTIYWNPAVSTDAQGQASVEFVTSDAITNFRATLEGISASGIPGHAEQQFFVEKPVSVSAKIPHSVISGDTLRLQVVVENKTEHPVSGQFSVEVPGCFQPILAAGQRETEPRILPKQSVTLSRTYLVGTTPNHDAQPLRLVFRSPEAFEDQVESQIRVLDRGFPARHVLTANQAQNQFNLHLMEPVAGTLRATLTAYPSPLEDVLKGMERMLRQPSGCFEQVSSSNYPNLLVLDLLRSTGTARPEVESQARALLEDGYKKLTAYECKSGGFDWWGRDPGHEGLTAYGLLQFTDMSRVFAVDQQMLGRTAKWLISRRDGKGSWKRTADQHGWQTDGVVDAYIAWAVAEAGYGKQFQAEIDHACQQAGRSGDAYQIALLANAMTALKDPRAAALLTQLLDTQAENGSWVGTTHSIMYAYGDCFRIETTALAALALMKAGKAPMATRKALDYLIKSKTEYGYGSTQSTVVALRALVEFAKQGSQKPTDGQIVVQVDGQRVAERAFSTQQAGRLEITGLERYITHDQPRMEVFFEGKNGRPAAVIPFDVEIQYASRLPRNTAHCPIALRTELGKTTAHTGETVRLSTVLTNTTAERVASPMVVLGIPAGLTLQPWQLKKLMEEKQCDFYELWDGFAVFHFESLAPGETRHLNLDLRADVAGTFEAPASQAFLYYQNDQRVWSKPERLVVQ